jgi:hypothetical protein
MSWPFVLRKSARLSQDTGCGKNRLISLSALSTSRLYDKKQQPYRQ